MAGNKLYVCMAPILPGARDRDPDLNCRIRIRTVKLRIRIRNRNPKFRSVTLSPAIDRKRCLIIPWMSGMQSE